jgi:hypothetical protein
MHCDTCQKTIGPWSGTYIPIQSTSGKTATVCSTECKEKWYAVIVVEQQFNESKSTCPSCGKKQTLEAFFKSGENRGLRCFRCDVEFLSWEIKSYLDKTKGKGERNAPSGFNYETLGTKADKPLTVVEAAKLGQATANSIDLSDLISVLPLLSTASERTTALREINDQHEEQYRLAVLSTLKAKNPDSVLPDDFVSKEVLRVKEFGLKVLNETPELHGDEISRPTAELSGTQIKKSAKWSDLKKNL